MKYKVLLNSEGSIGYALKLFYFEPETEEKGEETMMIPDLPENLEDLDFYQLENRLLKVLKKKNQSVLLTKVVIYGFEVITVALALGTINDEPISFMNEIAHSNTHFVDGEILNRIEILNCFGGDLKKMQSFPNGCKAIKLPGKNLIPYIEGTTINIMRKKMIMA